MLRLRTVVAPSDSRGFDLDPKMLRRGELRHAADGWHAILPLGGASHRLWLQDLPAIGSPIAVELQLDSDFDVRARAALRLWLALERRPTGPSLLALSEQRRQRLILAMRALDGWLEGHSYRDIATGLFGRQRVPERGWKTFDLRNRTIRLVQTGVSMMRGGYRALLGRAKRIR